MIVKPSCLNISPKIYVLVLVVPNVAHDLISQEFQQRGCTLGVHNLQFTKQNSTTKRQRTHIIQITSRLTISDLIILGKSKFYPHFLSGPSYQDRICLSYVFQFKFACCVFLGKFLNVCFRIDK